MKKLYILFLLFLVGCSYESYKTPKNITINLNKNVFEVYEKHYSNELISNSDIEVLNNEIINTNQIGKYIYTLNYKYKNKTYKYDVEYEVIDSTNPILISSPTYIPLEVGSNYYFCDNIAYGDNYDSDLTCYIEGEYDFNTIGTYDLEYVIKDLSGNEARENFVLDIKKELEKNTYKKGDYLYIEDILKNKNENTSIGIDISRWQGNIDFNKVKDAGIEFVIIRIGYPKNSSDEYEFDMKFEEYYKQAKEAGLKVSVYLYTEATTKESGIKAALWIINKLNFEKTDLPIAYDFENWKNFNNYHVSLKELSDSYLAFERTLNRFGYEAMLYSVKYYLENAWMGIDNTNIWLAQYLDKPNYQGKFMLWQMTDLAKIDGIEDNTVDIDILYKK